MFNANATIEYINAIIECAKKSGEDKKKYDQTTLQNAHI